MTILLSISDIITIIQMFSSFLREGGWRFEVQSQIPAGSNRMVHVTREYVVISQAFFLLDMREWAMLYLIQN